MDIDPEIMKEFLWATQEDLDRLEEDLNRLAEAPDTEVVNSIYRHFHSLKGSAGLVGLPALERAAHGCESLLQAVRHTPDRIDERMQELLSVALDAVKWYIVAVDKGEAANDHFTTLHRHLAAMLVDDEADVPVSMATPAEAVAQADAGDDRFTRVARLAELGGEDDWQTSPQEPATADSATGLNGSGRSVEAGTGPAPAPAQDPEKISGRVPARVPGTEFESASEPPVADPAPVASEPAQPGMPPREPASPVLELPIADPPAASQTRPAVEPGKAAVAIRDPAAGSAVNDSAVRVDVGLLDSLMNLVGELVLTRNQMLQCVAQHDDVVLGAASQALDQVTSELQDKIMRTRMQPINNIFNKFPRVVRDLSRQLGKRVELLLTGKETELDRTILEAMRDPFTHILRNSIDHGIERPEVRRAAGKSEIGQVRIASYHEGGQVIVEVSDDGAGVDPERVKAKAIAVGLIDQAEAQALSDQEAVQLITAPGLSTAEAITNISGRGVGMDVVRANVEKIGGNLDIASELGRGSTIRIRIPLTLAIIPALMVGAGGQLFGVPQLNLVELVGLEADECIERVRGAEVYRLRDRLLTVVRLREVLGLPVSATAASVEAMTFIVVVAAGEQHFGLLVDDIYDTEEIVVKPLSPHLNSIEQFAGATIRGDGAVCLILDVAGIARAGHIESTDQVDAGVAEASYVDDETESTFLVFDLGCDERFALPLQLVARVEEYRADELRRVDGRDVICHAGQLLPVMRLDTYTNCPASSLTPEDPLFAIVLQHRLTVAILAHRLVDSLVIDLQGVLSERSLLRSPIIGGLVVVDDVPTALIDAYALTDAAYPDAGGPKGDATGGVTKSGPRLSGRVLYAEDAQFFQKVVRGYLEEAGLEVEVVDHGQQAWERVQAQPERYDLILTDLEMPVMDGWDFIKALRSLPALDQLPVIALTSLEDEAVRQKTLQCGATAFVVKLDRGRLLDQIRDVLRLRVELP